MHPIFRRFLSSTVKELGADLPTSEIFGKKSLFKFFKLEEIYDFEDVVQAPEGSVVGINQVGPTSHKKVMATLEQLIHQNTQLFSANAQLFEDVRILKADVKVLKLSPRAIQICETIKEYQRVLIKAYLPAVFIVLSERNRSFLFLKEKEKSATDGSAKEISKFFSNPFIGKLYKLIISKEYKKIISFRNERAHEAIDNIQLIIQNFVEISDYFREKLSSGDFNPDSLDLDGIKKIHQHIIMINEFKSDEDEDDSQDATG